MRVAPPSGVLPFALPLLVLLPQSAGSATIRVPQDESTVQAGIDAAAMGDTVLVACGTYLEHDVRLAPGVILRGETGAPDCVVIDAQRLGRVLFGVSLPVGTRVEGITFAGGYNRDGQDFGREMSSGPGDPYEALAPDERDFGGGGGAYLILSSPTFVDCIFDGNEARVHAGGARCEGGSPVFERCVFRDNLSGNHGGGLYAGPGTRPVLADCELLDNTADYGGGVYAASPDAFTCTGTRFEGNHARVGAGGLHTSFCDPVVDGCTFVANTAARRGGAIAVFGGTAAISSTTIALNDSPVAPALRLNTATVQVRETIIALQTGGEAVECVSTSLQLTCCDVWSNENGDWVGCLAGQDGTAGNFSADPRFCSWPSRELDLQSDSPCLPANNSCGVLIGAGGAAGCSPTVPLFLDTAPTGLTLELDGQSLTGPVTVDLVPGSLHTVATVTPQLPVPDERYTFSAWSDSGAITHAVTAADSADTLVAFFTAEFLLTTTATAGGTVTPAGSAFFPQAAAESLEAFPDSGYGFAGWTGTGNGSYTGPDNPIAVTMQGPITQHAAFELVYHTVTMAADSGGTVTPAPGDHSYVDRTVVAISAAPDTGWKFTDWTGTGPGSYTGTANPAQIAVYGDIMQTAHFELLPRYVLTMVADPGGSVSPPTADYIVGTQVAISATPSSGYAFTGWTGTGSGAYTGANNPATVTMNGDITQTAHFAPLFPLTMVADSGGTVTPPSGQYPQGTVVSIQAAPLAGYVFTDWTGAGPGSYTGTDNPASVTVDGAITQTAHFVRPATFPLTMAVGSTGGGTVQPASGDYPNGAVVQITAIPDSVHTVLGWVGKGPGSYSGIKASTTITMNGAITQTAYFQELPKYTLTMIAGTGGTVLPGTGQYYTGTQVTITAVPDPGNGFVRWSGQGFGSYSGPSPSVTITLTADVTETAFFEYDVPVTIATTPPGLRIGVDGVDHVSPQTFLWRNTSFHAVDVDSIVPGPPGERQRFGGWADGVATVARTIDVPDTGITYTAMYAPELFLDFVDPPEGVGLPGDSWHPVGAAVSIEAAPNPGHLFASWTGQGNGSYTGTNNPASVTMNEPLVQTASYDSYGYEFSISTSSTDPYVNTRAPTGGASSLYLWMTCTDTGIAAFEADVSSTVPYSAFNPAPGVLNAGGTTNLFLAFTGCPGVGAPYLVGTLTIADTGGEVCLVPSANGRIGAVSCTFPNFLVDPVRLTGFSSGGEPPCYIPGTPCLNPVARTTEPAASPPVAAEAVRFADAFRSVHPNPFLGRTTLRFSAAGTGPARLAIYDVTGRLVRRVLERTLTAGEHEAVWDGRGGDGARAPAGVYFARLQLGALDETRKIVLLGGGR